MLSTLEYHKVSSSKHGKLLQNLWDIFKIARHAKNLIRKYSLFPHYEERPTRVLLLFSIATLDLVYKVSTTFHNLKKRNSCNLLLVSLLVLVKSLHFNQLTHSMQLFNKVVVANVAMGELMERREDIIGGVSTIVNVERSTTLWRIPLARCVLAICWRLSVEILGKLLPLSP